MLEPHAYRAAERLAKSQAPSWLIAQPHNLDHFERSGFPVRIESIGEIGQLLDTMQEGRFQGYMSELGGLTDAEYAMVLGACRDVAAFQRIYVRHRQPVLPLSTLLSAFALYKKMRGINSEFHTALEIGPGCGYLSFFLKQHAALENYSQVEACESFYIMQSLVNSHCFRERFEERASPHLNANALDYFVNKKRPGLEFSPTLNLAEGLPRCSHFPWWRLGELASQNRKFEIVTSNANLLEFNPPALDDYLELIHQVMTYESVFLVQCPGFPANGTYDTLLDRLWEKGFALLAFIRELTPVELKLSFRDSVASDFLQGQSRGPVTFPVHNMLLVRAGHRLFDKYRNRKNFSLGFCGQEELVHSTFFARPADRKMRSWQQFVEETERACAAT